ncbi:JmjC domain-containing protein [Nocardia sp. NPDC052566]|uniref:JmjC domain-containing protein n=1 Tax=Nocardia sp. NPDC052566 TaxID=3364330 RepID=UPI0037CC338C
MSTALDFADWFAPHTLEQFGRSVLSKEPFAAPPRRDLAERVRDAVGIHAIEDAFALPGATVYTWFHDLSGRLSSAPIAAEVASRFYGAGTTLFYKVIPTFAPLEREAAAAFRVASTATQLQLFCNRPGAITKPHYDPVDVITMQLTGRKTWRIGPNTFAPQPLDPWAMGEPVSPSLRNYTETAPPQRMPAESTEHVLEPGSVLHVPRGYWHETTSDRDSISLHLVLNTPLRIDRALAALKSELLRDTYWREAIYDFGNSADTRHQLDADRLALAAAVSRLTTDDLLRPAVADHGAASEATFTRAGQAAFGVDALEGQRARISVTAYGFRETTTASTDVHQSLVPALTWINGLPTGTTIDISELLRRAPGSTEASARELLRTLEQTRLVRRTS